MPNFRHTLVLSVCLSLPGMGAHATPVLTVLHAFINTDGANPAAALHFDASGNLYGTTTAGGTSTDCEGASCGLVFELSPPKKNQKTWSEAVLTEFTGINGAYPTADLIADASGNLYSTTHAGGTATACPLGCGTVYELSPPATGQTAWTQATLTSFGGAPGELPTAGLIADAAGNLYGTLADTGATDFGNIFELSPPATGKTGWKQSILTKFPKATGWYPFGALLADSAGNLYGTTYAGGASTTCLGGCGTIYELSPPATGQTAWTQTTLFTFTGTTGAGPEANLIADSSGKLYGTTYAGGTAGYGTIFRLTPPVTGQTVWTQTTLFSFTGANGQGPTTGLIADSSGNLYGTTEYGGTAEDGTIFELSPPAKGKTAYTQTVLISFTGTNGANPVSNLIADSAGNLYGTTYFGGPAKACEYPGCGVVFELAP